MSIRVNNFIINKYFMGCIYGECFLSFLLNTSTPFTEKMIQLSTRFQIPSFYVRYFCLRLS